MIKSKILLPILLIVTTLLIISCQDSNNPIEPLANNNPSQTFAKITIPFGAVIDSAAFYINVANAISEEVTLHRITSDWQELMVTWNNFGGSFDANIEGSFTPNSTDWYSVDITSLVTSWLDSTYANYGLLLKETSPAAFQNYSSRESSNSPYLKVWWTFNGSNAYDSTGAFADSYIESDSGDINFGSSLELLTGWQDTVETQTLINFEFEVVYYNGCTRGKGYWKTHSKYGPAPYDSVWALVAEDSTFFLSEQTYYEVCWTPPSGGNSYYQLAHVYIATLLNFMNGADPSEVQEAFDDATELFENYTPAEIGALKGNNPLRQQFIYLKNMLSKYNDGEIGPGNCVETYSTYPFKTK